MIGVVIAPLAVLIAGYIGYHAGLRDGFARGRRRKP